MVGLLLAILLVPSDVEPAGALRLPALIFIVSLGIVPVLGAIRDPKSIFRAEHVLLVAPIYWLLLDPLQGRYDLVGVAPEQVERSFIAIALFAAGGWLAFMQRPWRAPRALSSVAASDLPAKFYFGIGALAFTLAFLKYAIPAKFDVGLMASSLAGGRWAGPWQRGDLGGADAFLDHLAYFGYLLPPLTAILARRLGWSSHRTLFLAFGALVLSLFLLQGGGRRLVGMFFGAGILVWFLETPKLRLSTVLALVVLLGSLLFTFELMLSYRNVGIVAAFDQARQSERLPDEDGVLVRVDDNFLRLTQATEIFPDLHPYTTWRYALWVAVRPVPRLFWPGKPVDPGFDLPAFLGRKGVSFSSSVIGELFMAGGFLAVALGGWFYGRLARSLSHMLEQSRTSSGLLIYSIGVFALFVGMRSMIELVLTSYVSLAWILLVRIYDSRRPSSRPATRHVPVPYR